MENDDRQIGHILSRREVLALLGAAGAAALAACAPGESATAPPATATVGPVATATAAAPPAAAPTLPATVAPSATARASAAPSLNAEAATATALPGNPTAVASQQGQVATAAVANTAVASAAAAGTIAVPSCIVRPEVTEGPYYVAEDLNRSDVRSDPGTGAVKDGALLTLTFNVAQVAANGCTPLAGAKVEIWHCDAAGVYSDVNDPGFSTKGQRFLRGYQLTDANGRATFTTIYPGWYRGRAVHIHFKIGTAGNRVFTSQLFFDDALSDQVFAQAPYAGKGRREVLNARDGIYKRELLLTTAQAGQGYAASFDIGIQRG